jgi:hypothetical protein
MAARGYPRSTVDIDLLTSDARVFDTATWVDLTRAGAHVDARRGDLDDPLGGVVHILLVDGTDVDVIVTKWKWEADILERAEEVSIAGSPMRVPRIADLILLKLAAGGQLDLRDAAALLALSDRSTIVREVEAHIAEIGHEARNAWRELLAAADRSA